MFTPVAPTELAKRSQSEPPARSFIPLIFSGEFMSTLFTSTYGAVLMPEVKTWFCLANSSRHALQCCVNSSVMAKAAAMSFSPTMVRSFRSTPCG